MPYIPQERRDEIAKNVAPQNAGELNFVLTRMCLQYLEARMDAGPDLAQLRYQDLNDVVGALESAKAELQRRLIAPYENAKIKQNGDVGFSQILDVLRLEPPHPFHGDR